MKTEIIKLLVNYFYKPIMPVGAVLYLTDKCNLKCKFCEIGLSNINKENRLKRELSTSQLDNIVNALIRMKVKNMYITGGEPFLANNLWYLLDLCSRNSITIDAITTNGSTLGRLTDEQINSLNKCCLKKLIISVDHADAKKHDALRGKEGLFAEIENFLKSNKSEAVHTRYCLSTVISKENYQELPAMIEWASSFRNISHVNFQPVCVDPIFVDYDSKEDKKDSFCIDNESLNDLNKYVDTAIRKARDLKVSTPLPFLSIWLEDYFKYAKTDTFFFLKVMKGFVCSKPYNYIFVNYNGDLLACTHIGPVGNIDKGDIVKTWQSAAEKYRTILKNGKYFKQCRNCFCDFGANYRNSLIYKPIKNAREIVRMGQYYFLRYIGGTK